jgi:diguanylate cyclase (GGDEF)-like protein
MLPINAIHQKIFFNTARRSILIYVFLTCILALFCFPAYSSDTETSQNLQLTIEEKEWLKSHPVIKVGNDNEWPPYDFFENGKALGYSMDLLRELADIIGLKLEFVQDQSWNALTKQFEEKKLDVLTAYEITPEHKKHALFTEPYLETLRSIVIRKGEAFLKNYKALYGKKVAVVRGYDYEEIISKNHSQVEMILVDTPIEGLKKVSFGEADAFLENSAVAAYLIKIHGFPNLAFAGNPDFPGMQVGEPIRIAIRNDWPELKSIFSKALKSLPDQKLIKLRQKWLETPAQLNQNEFMLTEQEKTWIKSNPVIKVAVDASWAPIEYKDDAGRFQGISSDYWRLLEGKLGIEFQYKSFAPWKLGLEAFKEKNIDIMSSFARTPEREEFTIFTRPFISMPISIFTRSDNPYVGKLENLIDKNVSVLAGSAAEEYLATNYPKLKLIPVESISKGLEMLDEIKSDALVGNLGTINYYIEKNNITNVRLSGNTPFSYDLTLGIRKDWPEFALIMQKAMDNIGEDQREQIFNRWMSVRFEHQVDYQLIIWIGFIALVIIGAIFYWNRMLEKQVRERTSQLQHQAYNDSLTNLPNRLRCLDYLEAMLEKASQHKYRFAVMFVDLDDFKSINDSMGHEAGDKLLIDAAIRLKSCVHSDDFVGRLGGDEFVVIVNESSDSSHFNLIADKILSNFQSPFNIGDRHLRISASIGISTYPDDGKTASVILSNADAAMYHSKNIGRNVHSFFTEAMNQEVELRLKYVEKLNGALERGEIECHFQPKLSLPSLEVKGFEVLARWNNPELGQVSPTEFIPIAESIGLIIPIGQFVYEESLAKLSELQTLFQCNFTMAINLSPIQFRDTELVKWIRAGAEKCDVDYRNIELEITEGVLLNEYDYVINALSELTSLGIHLSLDDFGTGYSSMSYLRKYPFDSLKIDREFIRDMTEDNADKKLVKTTVSLAHELGMEVVAEGVEMQEHVAMLSEMHCDTLQGYLFSKPLPYEMLIEYLKNQLAVS